MKIRKSPWIYWLPPFLRPKSVDILESTDLFQIQ